MTTPLDQLCIDTLRFLAVDMVQEANSGHPGMPMGAAPAAYTVWDRFLHFDPSDPAWPDRDRFVLSAGHGCALLYALLHLAGYDLPMEELQRFRQWGSRTPGHPEFGMTPGVEATTGPLGQGIANAVGMAIAEESLAARFNRPGHKIVDHYTYVLCSDGDLMEGVAAEAVSLAGHLRLGKLIVVYDDNRITIEGPTELAFSEDVLARFAACGWHVQRVSDGTDVAAIEAALAEAKAMIGAPSLVAVRTHIGYGSPNKQDTSSAHGEPLGEEEVQRTKEALGWPLAPAFYVPEEVRARFAQAASRGLHKHADWRARLEAYRFEYPELASEFERRMRKELPEGWDAQLPVFGGVDGGIATRDAGGKAINAFAAALPELTGGSADLAPSTKTQIIGEESFSAENRSGRNMHFGVREHAMGAVMNGMAYHGGFVPFGSTFLVFSDYLRPALRLAALSGLHVIYVFTHDSIGLGEDGPTHQAVEHLASLRAIPGLLVIRPADANETVEAWRIALMQHDRPVCIVLSRQKVPVLDRSQYPQVAQGVVRGGYILAGSEDVVPEVVLVASGSEVALALETQVALEAQGMRARVVSMVCVELFAEQVAEYREAVVPQGVPVVSVEAGVTQGWRTYFGNGAVAVGLNRFGASAPGDMVMRELGITVEAVLAAVKVATHV